MGQRKPSNPVAVVVAIVLAMGCVGYFASKVSALSDMPDGADHARESGPIPIKAEDIVRAKPSQFACVSRDSLQQAIRYSVAGEKTKFAVMFQRADCLRLPEGASFKVLHAESDILEVVSTTSGSSEGRSEERRVGKEC